MKTCDTPLPSSLPTVVVPRDLRKKEKFLKHITGKAWLKVAAVTSV